MKNLKMDQANYSPLFWGRAEAKKIVLFLLSFFLLTPAFSQWKFNVENASGYVLLDKEAGVDYVFIINEISSSTMLEIDTTFMNLGQNPTINWYKFSNPNFSINNTTSISPDGDTGYILEVGNTKKTLWVFEYQDHILDAATMSMALKNETGEPQCEQLTFTLSGIEPLFMKYEDRNGGKYSLDRVFMITYNTLEWGESDWLPKEMKEELKITGTEFTVSTPLVRTVFTISGDAYAELMGINPLPSIEYAAEDHTVGIDSHVVLEMVTRDALNEIDRPKDNAPGKEAEIEGSAPLEINFKTNSSEPSLDRSYPSWTIYHDGSLIITRSVHEHRYTFTEYGKYKVKLELSNEDGCLNTDSISISVSESFLKAPNAFSPNGDGKNDEFRVAYRSLETFHCWVYNNWGKLVFEWTDPSKGWDGTINGRDAAPGTYFYIIRAKGTDGKKRDTKGDINLFR